MREFQDCLRRPQYILTHQYIEGNHPSPQLHLNFTSTSPQLHLRFTSAGQDLTNMLSRWKLSQTAWMSYSPPDTQINGWEGKKRLIIVFANLVSLPSVICCPEIIIFSAQCTHLQQPPQFWHLVFWQLVHILGDSFLFLPIVSQKHTWKLDCWQNNWVAGVHLQRYTSPIYFPQTVFKTWRLVWLVGAGFIMQRALIRSSISAPCLQDIG